MVLLFSLLGSAKLSFLEDIAELVSCLLSDWMRLQKGLAIDVGN
jgi:hypothetical protein